MWLLLLMLIINDKEQELLSQIVLMWQMFLGLPPRQAQQG